MTVQFQCPFCGVAMQADASDSESSVDCPSCGQSFVLELPAEPVRVKATVIPTPVRPPAPQGQAARNHRTPMGPHRNSGAHREKQRAKLAIVALLGGIPLLLGGLIWVAVALRDSGPKPEPIVPPGGGASALLDHVNKQLEERRRQDEADRKHASELARQYEAGRLRAEQEQRDREQAMLIDFLARETFDGDRGVATEAANEIMAARSETLELYQDGIPGNEPADPRLEYQRRALERFNRNPMIAAWTRKRSLDMARVFRGRPLTTPDGNPVDPESIQGMLMNRQYTSTGTGFWISSDGWLLTNAHVVGNALSVDLRDASGGRMSATVVKADFAKDLALLKASATRSSWLPIYDKDVPVGTPVFTAGFPQPMIQGLASKVTFGEVNSLSGMMDNKDHLQCSVPVQPGNSGGALTARGWAVGVIFSRLGVAMPGQPVPENVSYAIKPSVIRAFIEGVSEAKPLLARQAPATVERDQAIKRAQDCAVLILVK